MKRPSSLRTRLLLVVTGAAAAFLALLTAAFNVVLDARLGHDEADLLRQRAAAQVATLDTSGRRLKLSEAPDAGVPDAATWIFAGRTELERPPAVAANERAAEAVAGLPRRYIEVAQTDTRMYAAPVTAQGHRLGTVVSAISLAAYERTAHIALLASVILAAILLVAIALAARWAVAAALRPVARMTAEAAERTDHDLDRRFALGKPHDELTQLAATFDQLLGRVAAALRHEQRFTAELSHELRTPLARLVAEADLALRRDRSAGEYRRALNGIRRAADQMQRTLEALLAAARAENGAGGVSDAAAAIERAAELHAETAAAHGVEIDAGPARAPLRVGTDVEVTERVLAPLIENACRHARSRVAITTETANGEVHILVRDDGTGVSAGRRDTVFEPGSRGDAANGNGGAGLGLPLARRLARAARGDVELLDGQGPGATFRVRLPAA